jgi:hypothetical protein
VHNRTNNGGAGITTGKNKARCERDSERGWYERDEMNIETVKKSRGVVVGGTSTTQVHKQYGEGG